MTHPASEFSNQLVNTGILQFGQFVEPDGVVPFRFCPEYLPAYPDLLAQVADFAIKLIATSEVDHLMATADSVPLGVACSLSSGMSLAYSRGRGEPTVYDLVGSYNSGHQDALLVNHLSSVAQIQEFIHKARSVGLATRMIITLLDTHSLNQIAGIPVRSVFRLEDLVQELVALNRLPVRHAQAVLDWLAKTQQANHHLGSELP